MISDATEFVDHNVMKSKPKSSEDKNGNLFDSLLIVDESRDQDDDFSEIFEKGNDSDPSSALLRSSDPDLLVYYEGGMPGSIGRDIRNMEIILNEHGDDPHSVLKLVKYDDIPMMEDKNQNEVLIRVEASSVSREDCEMRKGTFSWSPKKEPLLLPIVPGVDCVGTVIACGESVSNVKVGDRVAALVDYGANSRYMRLSHKDLILVPNEVSSDEAVTLIRVYTGAFQALATAVPEKKRYNTQPLYGKEVLVIGKGSLEDRATIDLAVALGASKVFVPCEFSQKTDVELMGAMPLPSNPGVWSNRLDSKVDIAIDSIGAEGFEYARLALNKKGKLVAIGMSGIFDNGNGIMSYIESAWNHFVLAFTPNTSFYYGVLESYINNKREYLNDLGHVMKLLQCKRIKPQIQKIDLSRIPRAHEMMDLDKTKAESKGFIVVDPWKK